jgi:hypothetical protein
VSDEASRVLAAVRRLDGLARELLAAGAQAGQGAARLAALAARLQTFGRVPAADRLARLAFAYYRSGTRDDGARLLFGLIVALQAFRAGAAATQVPPGEVLLCPPCSGDGW